MLTKKNLYAIPGWGFSSEIFNLLSTDRLTIMGLDYSEFSFPALELIAEHLAELLPNQASLFGWSFGGLIAIKLAALFPKKVNKLILTSSSPRFLSDTNWRGIDPLDVDYFIKELSDQPQAQIAKFTNLVNYPDRCLENKGKLLKYFLQDRLEQLSFLLNILLKEDLRKTYQSLTNDVLHIVNSKDAVIKQNEDQLKQLNPRIKVLTIENSGHAGFLSDRNFYQDVIEKFLFQ